MLVVNDAIQIPDEEFDWSYARSGGPGGQNVNKVASKAVLRWDVAGSPSVPASVKERFRQLFRRRLTSAGELVLSGQRFRDQERNRQDCLEKLAELIRQAATVPEIRRPTKPTKGSKQRRLADKRRQSAAKAARRKPASED